MRSRTIVKLLCVAGALATSGLVPGREAPAKAAGPNYPPNIRVMQMPQRGPQLTAQQRDDALRQMLPKIGSSRIYMELAKHLGVTDVGGRRIERTVVKDTPPNITNDIDTLVSDDSLSILGVQSEPSVAVNPIDQSIVVVVGHNSNNLTSNPNACSVYTSFDGGNSYDYFFDLPLFEPTPFCSDAVVRFSPDGTHVYYTYLDININTFDDEVVVLQNDGFNPTTWSTGWLTSTVAPNLIDKEWIGTHEFDSNGSGAGYVYESYTFFNGPNCDIYYQRFGGYLATVDIGSTLLAHSGTCGNPALTARVLQGSRPAGGPQSQVLICWYDAGPDGWSTGAQVVPPTPPNPLIPLNKFNIACRSSNDRGATFAGGTSDPETTPGSWIYAAKQVANEVAYYLGPMGGTSYSPFGYFRYSGAEFPAVAIDETATAHIAYTYNPTTLRFGTEQGSIGYGKAAAGTGTPLFPTWTKTAVGIGFGAQFFPALSVQHVPEGTKPYVYVGWNDCARSATLGAGKANLIYDTKFRKSTTGGASFGPAVLVTDHASLTDYSFIGDYIDSSANPGIYQIVWTDNRYARSIFSPKTHFFTDRY